MKERDRATVKEQYFERSLGLSLFPFRVHEPLEGRGGSLDVRPSSSRADRR
jgi:hypothetical protein